MKTLPKSKTIIIVISVIVVAILAIVIPLSISLSHKSNASDTYKVTLNKQGGSSGTSSVTATIDENMPKATAPIKVVMYLVAIIAKRMAWERNTILRK